MLTMFSNLFSVLYHHNCKQEAALSPAWFRSFINMQIYSADVLKNLIRSPPLIGHLWHEYKAPYQRLLSNYAQKIMYVHTHAQ